MTVAEIDEHMKRGRRYIANLKLLYALNRLKGHWYVSAFVKACLTRLGYRAYYEPRSWQRYI